MRRSMSSLILQTWQQDVVLNFKSSEIYQYFRSTFMIATVSSRSAVGNFQKKFSIRCL